MLTRSIGATAALFCWVALALHGGASASDHADGPAASSMPAADLEDFYAWHTSRGTIVAMFTLRVGAPGAPVPLDSNVLYSIHIDNTADPSTTPALNDNTADISIHVRFGQNSQGSWGVQIQNLPGASGTLVGPLGQDIDDANLNIRARADVFDTPFFFDIDGYTQTMTALADSTDPVDIKFASAAGTQTPIDGYAGANSLAVVVEFDATLAVAGNAANYVQMWVTSGVLQ